MPLRLKRSNKDRFRNISPDYTFKAPPYDIYSAIRPGGYFRMYHRVEAEKMKRSHEWVRSIAKAERVYSKAKSKNIQEKVPPIKTYIKEGVLNVEIGECNKELSEDIPIISQIIEKGMLKVELGDDENKKVVHIDLKGYWSEVS
jgi:anti-sigma28 factor (negative regulator of flagellin synthesis)